MKDFKVKVSEEIVNYVQRLGIEADGMRRVVEDLILQSSDENIVEGALFQKYEKRYFERNAAFEAAKAEIELKWIPEQLKGHVVRWNLDYASAELTIYTNLPEDYEYV